MHLTDRGREILVPLEKASREQIVAMLERLPEPQQKQLLGAMTLIQTLLEGSKGTTYILRDPRGLGIGNRLVEECLRFARQIGYRNMTLWTTSNLTAARKIYQKAGFELVEEAVHSSGKDLVSQTWARAL